MGEDKMLDWSFIDKNISEITYNGKYYFTTGHVKEGYYCLIYDSTDENSPVVIVNQQKSLQLAVSKAIRKFDKKFYIDNLEPPVKVIYHGPSDKGMNCYGKEKEVVKIDLMEFYNLIEGIVQEKIDSFKIKL